MRIAFAPYLLKFKEPGGTSRGVLYEKPTFLLKFFDESDPSLFGLGEAAVFPGLSPEADGNYVNKLLELTANIALGRETDLSRYSSIQFGLEQAILDFSNGGRRIYYDSDFSKAKKKIQINGLIWMGSFSEMKRRIESKLKEGFSCLKLKIGNLNIEDEISLIKAIRKEYPSSDLVLRLDANGAFSKNAAIRILNNLYPYDIHSVEQPVKAGNPEDMYEVCRKSLIPVALDEELIGIHDTGQKKELIKFIQPEYIILKPALCGGFSGALEWIDIAKENNTGWWITSALESNIGLDAIAQFTANIDAEGPQGLGTGEVFTNNFESHVKREGEFLVYEPDKYINYSLLNSLVWHS